MTVELEVGEGYYELEVEHVQFATDEPGSGEITLGKRARAWNGLHEEFGPWFDLRELIPDVVRSTGLSHPNAERWLEDRAYEQLLDALE